MGQQGETGGGTPPYERLRARLADEIRSGARPPGSRLPTVRELAAELGLAVNTVARSVKELEEAGLVETRGRRGTFVALHDDPVLRSLQEAAAGFAAAAVKLGVNAEEALAAVADALRARPSREGSAPAGA